MTSRVRRRRLAPISAAVLTLLVSAPAPRAERGAQIPSASNASATPDPVTGFMMGRVVDGTTGSPVPEAIVTINVMEAPPGVRWEAQRTMADATGRFYFTRLPGGQYSLRANRPGWIEGLYGSRRPNSGGDYLELPAGGRAMEIVLPIWKGAVVTGRVVDETGEPLVNLPVRPLRRSYDGGLARFTIAEGPTGSTSFTDDRGMYRLTALAPGDYVLGLFSPATSIPISLMADGMPPAEFRDQISAAASELGVLGSDRNQQIGDVMFTTLSYAPRPPPPDADGRLSVYPTTFFPAARTVGDATVLTLEAGAVREGLDIVLSPVRASRLSGRLEGPEGPSSHTAIALYGGAAAGITSERDAVTATGVTDANGAFTLLGVPPGAYVMRAEIPRRRQSPGGAPATQTTGLSLAMPIVVGDADVTGVVGRLQRDAMIRGRLEYRASPTPPTGRRPNFPISLDVPGRPSASQLLTAGEDGTFSAAVPRGHYLVHAFASNDWWPIAVMLDGQDVTERGIDAGAGDIDGLVIVYSDRPPRVRGRVTTSGGTAAPLGTVVLVFPVDPGLHGPQGRFPNRMPSARVTASGEYDVRGVLPGDYYFVALDGADASNWQAPARLAALSRVGTRITVSATEDRTLDLAVQAVLR